MSLGPSLFGIRKDKIDNTTVYTPGNPGEYLFTDEDDVEYPSFDDVITDENPGNVWNLNFEWNKLYYS